MSDIIRVGVIGYGYASKTFHAPLIAGTAGMALAAISSSDESKVKVDWPNVDVVADPKRLFNDPNIDLIVIPTPNDTHFPLAKAALEAGKHVVVDKPFTVTLSQARELDALARSYGRLLSVFHNRRWDSDFLTLKALLADGALGEVAYFESHFDRFRPQVRTGRPGERHLVRFSPALARPGGQSVWSAGLINRRSGPAAPGRAIHRLFPCGIDLSPAPRGAARHTAGGGGIRALYRPRHARQLCEIWS
jgi:predicted dehydrogenase